MTSRATYASGTMLPDPARLAAAQHIRRDPNTDEISWEPSSMMAQLIELGLINREEKP